MCMSIIMRAFMLMLSSLNVFANSEEAKNGVIHSIIHEGWTAIKAAERTVELVVDKAVEEVLTIGTSIELATQTEIVDVEKTYEQLCKMRTALEKPDNYSLQQAYLFDQLCDQEHNCIEERKKQAAAALGLDANKVPTIAVCFSGGGIRAFCETIGFLQGLEKSNLLATVSYASGLSGSTWALNSWVASGLSLEDYKEKIIAKLELSVREHLQQLLREDLYDIMIMLCRRYYSTGSIEAIDIYGAFLTHIFLKDFVTKPYLFTLDQLKPAMLSGAAPFIMSTAVVGDNPCIESGMGDRAMIECTPLTCGSGELHFFIPSWAFGRKFQRGSSLIQTPHSLFAGEEIISKILMKIEPQYEVLQELLKKALEEEGGPFYGYQLPLGYIMGSCGSAFAVDLFNVLLELIDDTEPQLLAPQNAKSIEDLIVLMEYALSETVSKIASFIVEGKIDREKVAQLLRTDQVAQAIVPNPLYTGNKTAYAQLENLPLVDGGFELIDLDRLNIGIVPLLQRNVDVIIILDSSQELSGAPTLRAAETKARKLGLPFPHITYEGIDTRHCSIFHDKQHKGSPVVVYMPGISNSDYNALIGRNVDPSTYTYTSFCYPAEASRDLMGLIEFTVQQNREKIVEAILCASQHATL